MRKQEQKKVVAGGSRRTYKPQTRTHYRSKVSGLENSVFEYGLAKHAAQYVETEKAIANYVQKEYIKGGPDIADAIRSGKLPTITIPDKPIAGDEFDKRMWFHSYERAIDKRTILEAAGKRAYALVKGQCSPALVTKLEGTPGYEDAETVQDVCKLFALIRGICCQFDVNTQGTHSLAQEKRRVYVCIQKDMSNAGYLKEFQGRVKTVETYGGSFGKEPGLLKKALEAATDPDNPT